MKRRLVRQILNEWTANIWLVVELLLVSAVMWWLTDRLWVAVSTYNEPLGFDISHCYRLWGGQLNENCPDYIPYDDEEEMKADLMKLVDRLKARPEIEAVGLSSNSYAYNMNQSYMTIENDTLHGYFLRRWVSPDFFRVFRIHGTSGETPEQMAEALEKSPENSFMADVNLFKADYGVESMDRYVGQKFNADGDSTGMLLTKTFNPLRMSDFSSYYNHPSVITPLKPDKADYANEITVRVRENMDKDFVGNLMKDAVSGLRAGNWYIKAVDSFDSIREIYNRGEMQHLRSVVMWSVFLLVNIFLGILGTFWFRTSQRTKEIALRMVCGARRADILRRVMGEGMLLLVAVTPVSAGICYALALNELNTQYAGTFFDPARFAGCTLITFALVSLMIIVGSWIPARKAMSISPAEALKTE